MTFAQIINNEIVAVTGRIPNVARRLDTRLWVGNLPDASPADQRACGWFQVTDVTRPADTDTVTHDRTVELVDGTPTVVWTARPFTADEQGSRRQSEAPDLLEAVAAKLVAATNTDPQPWTQPTGAHDAWLPGAIVTDGPGGDRYRNTATVPNVWALAVYGWENLDAVVPVGPQPWAAPTGAHDAYSIGDRVTHNGQTWESVNDANVWEPGVVADGWVVV